MRHIDPHAILGMPPALLGQGQEVAAHGLRGVQRGPRQRRGKARRGSRRSLLLAFCDLLQEEGAIRYSPASAGQDLPHVGEIHLLGPSIRPHVLGAVPLQRRIGSSKDLPQPGYCESQALLTFKGRRSEEALS